MECQLCGKRFSIAGNIRNYKVVCPYCNHTQSYFKFSPSKMKMTKKKVLKFTLIGFNLKEMIKDA